MKKARIKPPPNWEDTPQSFEKFKRLAKGLMAVPKKDLDKDLAKHEGKKTQKNGIKRRVG